MEGFEPADPDPDLERLFVLWLLVDTILPRFCVARCGGYEFFFMVGFVVIVLLLLFVLVRDVTDVVVVVFGCVIAAVGTAVFGCCCCCGCTFSLLVMTLLYV